MKTDIICIYGIHPVEEALNHAPHAVQKVFVNPEEHPEFDALAKKKSIPRAPFIIKEIGRKHIPEHSVHQNIAAFIDIAKLVTPLSTFLENLDLGANPALAILGEIQDPHNVGAIIRSAAAFDLSGVLIPEHRQASITGVVIKASAGMAFRVPLVEIGNVNQTVAMLKEKGFWIFGLSGEATKKIGDERFDSPTAFIIGNEGSGIREKTAEHCDLLLRIPIAPGIESLNASVSAAIAFYEWSRPKS